MERSEEKLNLLYTKFDNDIKKRKYFFRILLAIDQLFNVILLNGSQDETMSSYIHRKQMKGESNWFLNKLCCFLSLFEHNHCYESRGE